MAEIARAGTMYEIGLQKLGEAFLTESFREAAAVFLRAVTQAFEAAFLSESFLFVQGSGLDVTIKTFGLPYDAQDLRGTFFWKLQRAQSASAITRAGHSSNGV